MRFCFNQRFPNLKGKKGPPDEAPKLENANQRFAFSLISDQHGSYLVKKLSDRLSMPRFLGTTRVARWSPTYRRWSAYARGAAPKGLGGVELSLSAS